MHIVECLAFWKTKATSIREMAKIYDMIVADDPEVAKQLNILLAWARQEAVTEELYNQGNC